MGAGRPMAELILTDSEREQLSPWSRRGKTAQALALRARIVLACSTGAPNKAVAAQPAIAKQTVCKWRGRFLEARLDGLLDAPRSGAPRTIDDARVDAVIAKTLETQPMNATHWNTRAMAKEAKLSQTAVSRSGVPSVCSHIGRRRSNSLPIRCSSKRRAISWACTRSASESHGAMRR